MKYILGLLVLVYIFAGMKFREEASDAYVRDRVFLLTSSNGGQCTGIQVLGSKSHKPIMLTAAHCKGILVDNKMIARDEKKVDRVIEFIEEDPNSDLMILTAATSDVISLGDSLQLHDLVHTLTHGHGLPTYRTDGEVLDEESPHMPLPEADPFTCDKMSKYVVEMFTCVLVKQETVSTAKVIPGSSGGPFLDEKGHLVGIVSGTDNITSIFVPLKDIQAFLKDK